MTCQYEDDSKRYRALMTGIYLESPTGQGCHEVLRLAADNGFVEVEMIRTADNLAVGECLGLEEPGKMFSLDTSSKHDV